MGRSFDRGGQSRKERMRGKRRAFQHAERDKEMREAVMQARRTAITAISTSGRRTYSEPVVAAPEIEMPHPAAISKQEQPGFFTRVICRLFGKAA
jgi:hypothetical protein